MKKENVNTAIRENTFTVFMEKHLHISWPVQFRPVLFKVSLRLNTHRPAWGSHFGGDKQPSNPSFASDQLCGLEHVS